jgi:general stress protein YciG
VATSSIHGRQFYEAIGHRGGETRKGQLGRDGYSELGRKGGEATSVRHGPGFYSAIGRKGGQAVSRDRAHMSEIGRKGGEARADGLERKASTPLSTTES